MGKFDRVLIASDYDNTLVYTQGALEAGLDVPPMNERNLAALRYFMDNGGYFTVATGRAMPAFVDHVATLPHNAPCIIANGAGLYDYHKGEYLYSAFLSDGVRDHVAALLREFPELAFEVYHTDRRVHTMHPNFYVHSHEHLTRAKAEVVSDFSEVDLPIIKLLFEDEREVLDRVRAFILSQPWAEEYELIFSSDHLLEMTARGATKGDMVLRLAELLGVARQDIYCIGDHANDLPMLSVAAVGFAPENAIEAVKQSGAQIVCHCADGALADVVEFLDARYS